MPAGPELAVAIAVEVMEWKWFQDPAGSFNVCVPPDRHAKILPEYLVKNPEWRDLDYSGPKYPTDIAAAWEVHRKMHERLSLVRQRYYREIQEAVQQRTGTSYLAGWPEVFGLLVSEDICRAALAAVRARREAT